MKNLDMLAKAISDEKAERDAATLPSETDEDKLLDKIAERVIKKLSERTTTPTQNDTPDDETGTNEGVDDDDTSEGGELDNGNGND